MIEATVCIPMRGHLYSPYCLTYANCSCETEDILLSYGRILGAALASTDSSMGATSSDEPWTRGVSTNPEDPSTHISET